MGKSSMNGPFSMAMLNNQRVYIYMYMYIYVCVCMLMLQAVMDNIGQCLIIS